MQKARPSPSSQRFPAGGKDRRFLEFVDELATGTQLAEAQSLLTAVLDNTINGILFVGTDQRVLYANRRLQDLLGVDRSHIVGKDARTVVEKCISPHVADPEAYLRRSLQLLEHPGETAVDQVEIARPARRILERYSAPVNKSDGGLYGRIDVYSDITSTLDLQRNKAAFLSLASHELKTPVTSIKGYAQLLTRWGERAGLPEQTMAAYRIIERQASHMQEMIDALLDLSRLEAGRLRLNVTEVQLTELAERVAAMVQMTAESHVLAIERPAAPIWVRGDPHRLEQVVMNLLANAVRYSPEHTTVRVVLRSDRGRAVISVTDEGRGIATEDRHHIFERFYRAVDAENSNGMGIGLYITKGIVEEHGGTIDVESEIGQGATFTVSLPLDQTMAPRDGEQAGTRTGTGRREDASPA